MEVKLQATVFYCHQVKLNKRTFSRLSQNTNKIINLTKKKEPFPAAQYHIFSQSYSTTYQNRFFLRKFISRKSCNVQSFDVGHFSTVFRFSTTTPDIITPFRGKQKSPSSGLAAAICTATAMEYSPCQHESLLSEYD